MDVYNPIFKITWPGPGVMGISIVLFMLFMALAVYILLLYLRMKERERLHNYQLFLFQVKRKGLNNFQIKILNSMADQMKKADPTRIVANAALFESMLSNFMEYLQRSREDIDDRKVICRDLLTIYEKLYVRLSNREPLVSMSGIENGQILYVASDSGKIFIGKVSGRGKDVLGLQLFTSLKNLKEIEPGEDLEIFIVRVNDADYKIRTKCAGIEENRLLAAMSDDIVKEKEYRHPYVTVVIPVVLAKGISSGDGNEEQFDGTIYRLNEYECEIRTESQMPFETEYTMVFEVSDYSIRVVGRVIGSRTVEHEKVYYVTIKFRDMSKPAMAVLSNFIAEHL